MPINRPIIRRDPDLVGEKDGEAGYMNKNFARRALLAWPEFLQRH